MRSQIDCYDEQLGGDRKTFDLKTRAVLTIRRDCSKYLSAQHLGLKNVLGTNSSFEREFYDLMRSVLIKYNFQARIGHMHGIFLAYHNTLEMFGFEYLSVADMDRVIYGNEQLGRIYDVLFQLLQILLERITNEMGQQTIKVLMNTNRSKEQLEIYALPENISTTQHSALGARHYILRIYSFANNRLMDANSTLHEDETFDVFYNLTDVTHTTEPEEMLQGINDLLQRSGLYDEEE